MYYRLYVWCVPRALSVLLPLVVLPQISSNTVGPLNITAVCPGVEYLLKPNSSHSTFLQANASDCEDGLPQFTSGRGVVCGLCGGNVTFCRLHVEVKPAMLMLAHIQRLEYWCQFIRWEIFMLSEGIVCSHHSLENMYYYSRDQLCISHWNNPAVTVNTETRTKPTLITQYTSDYSGYIIAPRIDETTHFTNVLQVPSKFVIILSVQQSYTGYICATKLIKVLYKMQNSSEQCTVHFCVSPHIVASVFPASYLQTHFHSGFHSHYLKIQFSAVSETEQPHRLPSGMFNCSVDHYPQFQQILHCNLKTECEDGRDETERCPFSGPGCQGLVASRNKCFKLIVADIDIPVEFIYYECQAAGHKLASVKNRKEQNDALFILKNYFYFRVILSYTSGWRVVPFTYSMMSRWSNSTLIYLMNHFLEWTPQTPSREVLYGIWTLSTLNDYPYYYNNFLLCEVQLQPLSVFPPHVVSPHVQSPQSIFRCTRQCLLVRPDNHVTHALMQCDSSSHFEKAKNWLFFEWWKVSEEQNKTLSSIGRTINCGHVMFPCEDSITTVHYTLLCDFNQDCPDNSDESFCEHSSCNGFLCSNGQCVLHSQRCNEHSDCEDDSDEYRCRLQSCNYCEQVREKYTRKNRRYFNRCTFCKEVIFEKKQRLRINLDGNGYFTHQRMTVDEPCPDSHYSCTTEWLYCLPVYTRCNGIDDCVYGEDEQDCESVGCFGLYQCRASTVCVHRDHLCDGWGQCPQRDDELMCDMTCPEDCLCQGQFFLCRNAFSAVFFPQLRYVNATGSGMVASDFATNVYLIYLSLSRCALINVSRVKLPNLLFIDLSDNYLRSLDINQIVELPNLRFLSTASNPISFTSDKSMTLTRHVYYSLKQLDLTYTKLTVLRSELSVYLPVIKHLNVSFSFIEVIGSVGFKHMPQLSELDIRFNPVMYFPLDLLSECNSLLYAFSSNYRICCKNILPKQSSKLRCVSPYTSLPSCTKLIPNEQYRTFFWVVSMSATLGNLVCLAALLMATKVFESNVIMIAHCLFANFCTGCHVSIVTVASELFHDRYIQFDKTWTHSVSCKVAGFLFLLSTEVSVLNLLFITMDHIVVMCFHKDSRMVYRVSEASACSVAWCVGALLSLIPFLPGLSHWGLRDQSGLCRLALFDQYSSKSPFRWFTVITIADFMTCFSIMACQIFVHRRTPKHRVMLHPAQRGLFTSVQLIWKVATTTSVCWISFGVVTIMTTACLSGYDQIHGGMVVFMLPLSSALSPFFYTWTVATQHGSLLQIMPSSKIAVGTSSRKALLY